jgi:glycosyltransferase involved in cell wall biosynthesis
MTKVSIITRTKNRPLFLRRAFESVNSQTYPDYEHIIINDGGPRSDVDQLVDSFTSEVRSKIKIFHRDYSSDAPDTILSESVDRTDSDYFVIHDDDDTWHPDFLSQSIEYLDEHSDIAAVVVRCDKIVERVEGSAIITKKQSQWMPDLKVVSLYRQCIDNQLTPIATVFRRSSYVKVGKFDSTLPVVGDWEFGVRLLMKYDVGYVDPGYALAYYHHRKYQRGVSGNTSFAGNDLHRHYTNKVANKYLREELNSGRLGVGYIMSNLKYNQMYASSVVKKLLPLGIVERFKSRIRD